MKLSTKGRYGVRLMMDLARHYNQGTIALKDIALRQAVSEKYLWQLVNPLKNAGLVSSTRGSQGGYCLAEAPEHITLKEILLAVEGPLNLVDCTLKPVLCSRSARCAVRDVWGEVSERLLEMLDSYTLKHLIDRQQLKEQVFSYSI